MFDSHKEQYIISGSAVAQSFYYFINFNVESWLLLVYLLKIRWVLDCTWQDIGSKTHIIFNKYTNTNTQ